MLIDVLNEQEKNQISKEIYSAITNLSEVYYLTKQKKRHHIARSLRKAGLTLHAARSLGYPISTTLWKSCLNTEERNNGGK